MCSSATLAFLDYRNRRYAVALEQSYTAVTMLEAHGETLWLASVLCYLFINPVSATLLDRTVEEVVGKHDSNLFSSKHSARITAVDQQVMVTGESLSYEQTAQSEREEVSFLRKSNPTALLGVISSGLSA